MAKKRRLCFIDDEQDERSRAERALSQHFAIGAGADLDTAMSTLPRKPHLFLLDMYYGPDTQPLDRVQVAKKWRELSQAQRDFYNLLRSLGQSSKGGLELAEHVRVRYPGIPIVFFTRKGSLEDANEALRQGAAAVLKKPDATGGQRDVTAVKNTLDAAMMAHKDELARSLSYIIDRNSWWARHARLRGFLEGVVASIIASLLIRMLAVAVHFR
jgi:DNA-binding NtrC family response regulator